VNVKKQMINYRASLRTQFYLRSADYRQENEKGRTDLVSGMMMTTTMLMSSMLDRIDYKIGEKTMSFSID
jgi:hypothetical protein